MSLGIFEVAKNTSGSHSGETENVRLPLREENDLTRRTRYSLSPDSRETRRRLMLCLVVVVCGQKSFRVHMMSAVPHQKAAFAAGFSLDGPFTPDVKLLLYTAIKQQQQQSTFLRVSNIYCGTFPHFSTLSFDSAIDLLGRRRGLIAS